MKSKDSGAEESHLLDGHSASGVSHSGQHLEQMLRKVWLLCVSSLNEDTYPLALLSS